jgi:pyridoxamine 5'-phosphate oxidase
MEPVNLSDSDDGTDPLELISAWLRAARDADQPMPEAMALATVSPEGWPSVRMVILRGLDAGLVFYTDSESDKGIELATCPRAAVVLHWLAPTHRQVRAVGVVETVPEDQADEYWRTRRPQSRWAGAAWVQSRVTSSRAVLEERLEEYKQRSLDGADVPRPSRWCGYRIVPTVLEFWQGATDELHDRFRYRRAGAGWSRERLSP